MLSKLSEEFLGETEAVKKLSVWVNEDEYKRFLQRARSQGLTRYGLLKKAVLDILKL
jgi:hypothetical protein